VQHSYTKNYVRIYFWQGISVILNFAALFVVVPYLSSQPALYGIYSVCIGFAIFLSYADIGFISAGTKFAAEAYAENNLSKEKEIIGFSAFVLCFMLIFLFLFFLYCGFNPNFVIKDITANSEKRIASSLFFVLACSIPVNVITRIVNIIFCIRLEDYIVQRINIIGSLIRIASVFFFFSGSRYYIIAYYIFTQIVLLAAAMVSCFIARKRFSYTFKQFFLCFRFNKDIFFRVKNLAFSGLFVSIMWVIYYELDSFVIGKFIGANKVAIYAIGLTVLSFCRTILAMVYTPFTARFNHFIGTRDMEGFRAFYLHVIKIFSPFIFFSLISLSFMAEPFILSWVGVHYIDAVPIARWLLLCNLFASISYPSMTLLQGLEKIKSMYVINAMIPLIYWGGIIIFYNKYGLVSFAFFKCMAFFIPALFYIRISINFLKVSFWFFFKEVFLPLMIPLFVLFILLYTVRQYLPLSKSAGNLLITLLSVGAILILTFAVQLVFSKDLRRMALSFIPALKRK
jgi:O-antigen/teichoic acid export membrane protein